MVSYLIATAKLVHFFDSKKHFCTGPRIHVSHTGKIENLVREYIGRDDIAVHGDGELMRIKFSDVECISIIDRKLFVIDSEGKTIYDSASDKVLVEEGVNHDERIEVGKAWLEKTFIEIRKM